MLYSKRAFLPLVVKPIRRTGLFLLVAICVGLNTSCSKSDSAPPEKKPTIQLGTSTSLGSYLTDTLGNTLYYFSDDFDGQSSCAGGCLSLWPIYFAGDHLTQASLVTGLDIADFGTITTPAGKQTTYKTWPLYYYAPAVGGINVRENPGEIKGEGFGDIWYVAKPDYTIMLVNAQLVGSDGKNYKSDLTEGVGKTIYFTDANGVSLYGFSRDSFNVNKFTRADFSNNAVWPIYEMDEIVVPSTLDKSLFATTAVFDKVQLTYKGWPLYYFGQDNLTRGSNQGVSFPTPGIWQIMREDLPAAPQP